MLLTVEKAERLRFPVCSLLPSCNEDHQQSAESLMTQELWSYTDHFSPKIMSDLGAGW